MRVDKGGRGQKGRAVAPKIRKRVWRTYDTSVLASDMEQYELKSNNVRLN